MTTTPNTNEPSPSGSDPIAPLPRSVGYVVDHGNGATPMPSGVCDDAALTPSRQALDDAGTTPARLVPPKTRRNPCQGYGANTLRCLPGRVSRARARGRSGVRSGAVLTRQAQAVSGLTRAQRRQARAIAHRLGRQRGGDAT